MKSLLVDDIPIECTLLLCFSWLSPPSCLHTCTLACLTSDSQAGYKGLGNYGFLALQGLATKKDAKALFAKIDDNGGGVILLEEWCEYIKFVEVIQ